MMAPFVIDIVKFTSLAIPVRVKGDMMRFLAAMLCNAEMVKMSAIKITGRYSSVHKDTYLSGSPSG